MSVGVAASGLGPSAPCWGARWVLRNMAALASRGGLSAKSCAHLNLALTTKFQYLSDPPPTLGWGSILSGIVGRLGISTG